MDSSKSAPMMEPLTKEELHLNYHGYSISNEDGQYVARPLDGEELMIVSRDRRRVFAAVRDLWTALDYIDNISARETDLIPVSRCIRDWLVNPTAVIDLNAAYVRGAC